MQAFFVPRKRAKCFLSCSPDRVHLIDSHDLPTAERENKSVPFFVLTIMGIWRTKQIRVWLLKFEAMNRLN